MNVQVVVAARWKLLLQVLSAGVVFAAGVWALYSAFVGGLSVGSNAGVAGALLTAVSSPALTLSLVRLVNPPRLVLGRSALIIEDSPKKARRVEWAAIDTFFFGRRKRTWIDLFLDPWSYISARSSIFTGGGLWGREVRYIGFRRAPADRLMILAAGGESGFGREEALPAADFAMPGTAIVELLNSHLRQTRSAGTAVTPESQPTGE